MSVKRTVMFEASENAKEPLRVEELMVISPREEMEPEVVRF